MAGSGPVVFSVWGYIVAHAFKEHVLINPKVVCVKIGITPEQFDQAIAFLSAPDPNSQSLDEDGRRIIHCSGHQWFVVNHKKYSDFKTSTDMAEYNRVAQQKTRDKKKEAQNVNDVNDASMMSKAVNDCQTLDKTTIDQTRPTQMRQPQINPIQPIPTNWPE